MEKYDPEMAKRVWQRVRGEAGQTPPQYPSVRALLLAELEQGALLLQLSRQLQGGGKEIARRIYKENQTQGNILRGICFCMTGKRPLLKVAPASLLNPENALRKCYTFSLRAVREYENRTADPEYGATFAALAKEERAHCALLLELLGSLP